MRQSRIEWVDISKVLVIWLMVLGHILEKKGMDNSVRNIIYSFHMPFFFFISGYLYKAKEKDILDFTKVNLRSLIVPYVFLRGLSFLLLIPYIYTTKYDISNFLYEFISGDSDSPGGASWFLLCLFLVKMIFFLLKTLSPIVVWILNVIMVIVAYYIPYRLFWNIDAAFMAFPFFYFAFQNKHIIKKFISINLNIFIVILFISFSFYLLIVLSSVQGFVTLYGSEFGNSPLLFYFSAIIGIVITISFCKRFYSSKIIETFSKGTIVIMGIHGAIYPYIMLLYHVFLRNSISDQLNFIFEVLISFFILIVLYYPIIILQRFFPVFIGNRR